MIAVKKLILAIAIHQQKKECYDKTVEKKFLNSNTYKVLQLFIPSIKIK